MDDDPVRDDELGAHAGLAKAIAHLIESEPGGKAVALEGAWGAGKSTVIELLRVALGEGRKGRVFVFDGWAHEGDSLRRALVEAFAGWAKGERKEGGESLLPLEGRERLEKKVDEVTRRLTVQDVGEAVRLTPWGRVMVLLLSLVPLGVALASKATGNGQDFGVVLAVLPASLLVGSAVWVWGRAESTVATWLLILLLITTTGAAGWGLGHWGLLAYSGLGVFFVLECLSFSAAISQGGRDSKREARREETGGGREEGTRIAGGTRSTMSWRSS